MSATTVTVVICAYTQRRWDDLVEAVHSALRQSRAPDEVLVVIDHNDALLERARNEFGAGVRVVANAHKQGLSGGRNTAVAIATSDLIAFLDDDAAADPDWLEKLVPHFDDDSVAGAGARAVPRWPEGRDRPASLPKAESGESGELDWVVGCSYEGLPRKVANIRNLMGCNMILRTDIFGRVGGFSEDLGRIGRTPLGCEETEWCIRAGKDRPGARFVFDPGTAVHHHVSDDRLTWKYLWSRCYAEGVSKAAVSGMVGQDAALESERAYTSKVLPKGVVRELRRGRSGLPSAVAIIGAVLVTGTGYARGLAAMRTSKPSSPSTQPVE